MTTTAPQTAQETAPRTTPRTAQETAPGTAPEAVIAGARERIDALDDRIIGLIQERMAVSAVVQQTRIASGGRRVHLSREMEILARYRDALGKPGTTLAMTLLELSRGRI
ncbi:chorismate mutase [Streptomyces cinerochromogenes]|uniref:chorismate mutase n=1 Tax=Streptomyces cinerochromogenes TaxID=66422 RepID=UPI00166F7E7E|nr:chorismate mutase [Streptomyces cinerochromogenes]GGS64901.1 chorismate mutase [Streptomyces cinerochromogenes]